MKLTTVLGIVSTIAILLVAQVGPSVGLFSGRLLGFSMQMQNADEMPALIAGRYHLRMRTRRFFDRAHGGRPVVCPSVKDKNPRGERCKGTLLHKARKKTKAALTCVFPEVAGRYHLRGRTLRFFARARV